MIMNRTVKSADRVLDVFEAFGELGRPFSLSELAERIGAPISSCHGLVSTLQRRGYLYSADQRRLIYPTRRLLDVGRAIAEHDPILEWLRPQMVAMRDATGETVILGKRQYDAVLYLEVVEGTHTVRYTAKAGEHKPLHSSAIGKALLGTLSDRELDRILASMTLAAHTPYTITNRKRLVTDLREARRRGYSVTHGENVADVSAVACTLTINDVLLGLALAAPMHRMEAHLKDYVRVLAEARDSLQVRGAA